MLDEDDDLLRSAASIQSRSSGLLRFVQAYGTLTNLPPPRRSSVPVAGLLEQVVTLMESTLQREGVALETQQLDDTLAVTADPEQLQQVLINLVKNALEALAGQTNGRITLSAARNAQDSVLIGVADNGPGIDPAHLENVFVPFFTTKRRGTGVGLSISAGSCS